MGIYMTNYGHTTLSTHDYPVFKCYNRHVHTGPKQMHDTTLVNNLPQAKGTS